MSYVIYNRFVVPKSWKFWTIPLFAVGVQLSFQAPAFAQTVKSQKNQMALSPVQSMAAQLANDGIYFNSRYLGEFAANPSGGQRQGSDFAGELNFGATADLGRIAGIQGGSLNVLFTARNGRNLAGDTINSSVPVQQIYGDGQTYQLTLFTYNQSLFNNKLNFSLGRTELANSFLQSSLYCNFQSNALCGRPYALGKDTSTSFYPLAVWGANAQINPFPRYYLKVGIYQSNPTLNPQTSHGFDWNVSKSNGFLVPIELGYAWHPNGGEAENRYDIGVIFDRTHYTNPIYDAQGQSYLLNNTSPAPEYGRVAVYAQAQQMVYQDASAPERNAYAFAAALIGASGDRQTARYGGEVGFVDNGPFASRPHDSVNFGLGLIHYGTNYINSLYDARLAAGGTQRPNQNLIMAEINYNIQINNWAAVQPNLQYVIHPDGLAGPTYPLANLPNAFVVGIQFSVDIGKALGFDLN